MMRGGCFVGAAFLAFALVGCGPAESAKQPPRTAAQQTLPAQTANAGAVQRIVADLDPCAADGGAFEQKVCANRSLASLDSQIRATLASRAAAVSEAGAQLLVQNQERWREAQRIACGIANADAQPNAAQQICLENRFRARAQEAASAVQSAGGYTFQRVEAFAATPMPRQLAAMAGAAPATTTDIRFPRIDGPQTPQIQRFNALMAQRPQFRADQGANEVVRYEIAYAGPDLVSVRFNSSSDTPSTAQTSTNVKAVTVVMATGQALGAADVFRAGSGWEDFLTRRAIHDLAATYADYNFAPPERDVHETVTKPHLWLITEHALVLLFPPLSFGGSYDMGDTQVTIPWSELRRYLNPNAPSPIRPQA